MKTLTVLWCFCLWFTGLLFMAQISHAVTIDDAIGIWLFDDGKGDTAADASKNGNDGKLMEGPKWVDGKFGGAISFDVEGPFVRIEVPTVQLSSWTAMIWIKPNNPNIIWHLRPGVLRRHLLIGLGGDVEIDLGPVTIHRSLK